MRNVFVYGTLMSGQGNNWRMKDSRLVGKAVLKDYSLYDLGRYPGIVEKKGDRVKGELFQVPEELIAELNDYEDEGTLYKLCNGNVELENGESEIAGIYVYLQGVDGKRYVPFEEQPWKNK